MLQLVIAGWLTLLLVGYACGRRAGVREGRRLGEREAPLRLREDAYANGVCPLCGRTPDAGCSPKAVL